MQTELHVFPYAFVPVPSGNLFKKLHLKGIFKKTNKQTTPTTNLFPIFISSHCTFYGWSKNIVFYVAATETWKQKRDYPRSLLTSVRRKTPVFWALN